MRTMYDSVTPANIPVDAQLVAGYVDGRFAWSPADWARFPTAVHVRIACFASTNDGHVLDVEPGDATPDQAPGWVTRRRAAGVDPTVYCSAAAYPTVQAAFAAQHVAEPHWWIAAYPGPGPVLYAGTIAHQYADPGPYDLSVVADYWPGVDPAPTTPPAPTAPEDIMATLAELQSAIADELAPLLAAQQRPTLLRITGTKAAWLDLGAARRYVSPAQYAAMRSPGITDAAASDGFWDLPLIGNPGELVRQSGTAACWLRCTGGRQWIDAEQYTAMHSPVITDLDAGDPFWTLPTVGPVPTA